MALSVSPIPRRMTPDEEIQALRRELGPDAEKNGIILDRISALERRREAERIASATSAAQAAEQQAAERARQERQELADEEREIEAAMKALQASMNDLAAQGRKERPDLNPALVWETPQGYAARVERQRLERRLITIHSERMQLAPLLEEDDDA